MNTPSEYMFGTGPGHLPESAEVIARRHGAWLVNYTDAQCNCGHGCNPHRCKRSRRHWFATPRSAGEQHIAKAVLADIAKAGL